MLVSMVLDLFHLVREDTSNISPHYTLLSLIIMNGINIELTPSQFDYLYEVIMMAYELDVPDQKGWDMQTYDNMVDNVCNGKSTILSSDVKGIVN